MATSAHQKKDGELNWERQEMELVSLCCLARMFVFDDSSVTSSRESPGIKETARTTGSRAGSTGTALPTRTSWYPVQTPVYVKLQNHKDASCVDDQPRGFRAGGAEGHRAPSLFSSFANAAEEVTSWRTPEPGYKSVPSEY